LVAVAAALIAAIATRTGRSALAPSTEKANVFSNDHRLVAVLARLLVLPFFCLDATLYKELLALLAVLANVLGGTAEDHDRVPLRLVVPVSVPILPLMGRCQAKIGNGGAASGGANFRVSAQVSNENGFIDGHGFSSFMLENDPHHATLSVEPPFPFTGVFSSPSEPNVRRGIWAEFTFRTITVQTSAQVHPVRAQNMNSYIQFGDARSAANHGQGPVHLVVTSPPYWSIKDYGTDGQIGLGSSYEAYLDDLNSVWTLCFDRLLPGCRMCINIGDQFLRAKDHGRYRVLPIREKIIAQLAELGADYMGAIIWQKMTNTNTSGGGVLMGSYPHPRNGILKLDYEFILVFKKPGKGPRGTPEQKSESAMSIEEWSRNFSAHWSFQGERQKGHHAMFPRELPRRLIRMFSFPGERVLDPFSGAGTTVATAIEQGRIGEGIELNEDFRPIIEDRLGDAASSVRFVGQGEQHREGTPENFQGSATRIEDLGRDRWEGTARVELVEGPNHIRVNGKTWELEGLLPGTAACWEALNELVKNRKVVVEPTSESHAYIRLMNRTLVNARLIRMGVAEPDPERQHRNRTRFMRYAMEQDQQGGS
jgi:DNA modification methylase